MTRIRPQASSTDVLRLVQQALDDLDVVPLDATVRRTVRIANLLGETFAALRLGFELKASGGHPPANAEVTRRLMAEPETWNDDSGVARRAMDQYMAERATDGGLFVSHSLAEIEFWQQERFPAEQMTDDVFMADLKNQLKMVEILTRIRHQTFTYLCQWERQLTFAANQDDAIAIVRTNVDSLLGRQAPDVLDKFNVAFRRLREAADRDSEAEAEEELSQALTSCRRILKAVVDVVQPVDPTMLRTEDGHQLTDEAYKNRLVEFLRAHVASDSFRSALIKGGESLFERFSTIDGLTSKGVHARVALDEAEFCALNTYTLAGEIVSLAEYGAES